MLRAVSMLLLLLLHVVAGAFPILDLTTVKSVQDKVAIQTCAGLFNRNPSVAGPVYTIQSNYDKLWLADIEKIVNPPTTPYLDFLRGCVAQKTLVSGAVRYNYTRQQALLPLIVTIAGVLNAVPLEDNSPVGRLPIVFDAIKAFPASMSLAQATKQVFDKFGAQTASLAFINPGFNNSKDPVHPPLELPPMIQLFDFVVKQRIFAFYLNNACLPGTPHHATMEHMVQNSPFWSKPATVYGYDDTYPVAGDLFEAETDCVKEHNIGQTASVGSTNLSFFSRKPAVSTPLKQNVAPGYLYNSSKTYISFIIGDGDNIDYIESTRRDWMLERLSKCKSGNEPASQQDAKCFPLLWTISPHLLYLAPDILQWYYNTSYQTGQDYFVLPPSGHLYSYPSQIRDEDAGNFVSATESDATLLSTSATSAWESFGTWQGALTKYFPRYAAHGVMNAFFGLNVPFMLPVLEFGPSEFYKIVGGNVIVFRPRSWRGDTGNPNPLLHPYYLTPTDMAKEVNSYKPGTVTHIYLTSDGGASLDSLYKLVPLLQEHVAVVDFVNLAKMALHSQEESSKE